MIRSLIEDHLFESTKEDEECDYDHTLIDDSNMCKGCCHRDQLDAIPG